MQPLYKNDNAINFLKNEFTNNYSSVYEKIIAIMIKHGDPFLYHVYKNFAIVNLTTIYDINEYEKWLETKQIKTIKILI